MHAPHTVMGTWPEPIGSGRFAARIRRELDPSCQVALLGLPDETGVRLNGGRPGAAQGPTAIRAALARYGSSEPGFDWPAVCDAGDVVPNGDDLHETHQRVTDAAKAIADLGLIPLGLGGGHDLTFPLVRGVHLALGSPMRGIYFDAHLDVRDADGSGMPFRRLIEGGCASGLDVLGLDAKANSSEHLRWFEAHGGRVDAISADGEWPEGPLFVSLDLDVLDQAHAPGVSASNPVGWSSATAREWVRAAGSRTDVRCFDVMELSPPHDEGGRTARLAAAMVLEFIRGVAERRTV